MVLQAAVQTRNPPGSAHNQFHASCKPKGTCPSSNPLSTHLAWAAAAGCQSHPALRGDLLATPGPALAAPAATRGGAALASPGAASGAAPLQTPAAHRCQPRGLPPRAMQAAASPPVPPAPHACCGPRQRGGCRQPASSGWARAAAARSAPLGGGGASLQRSSASLPSCTVARGRRQGGGWLSPLSGNMQPWAGPLTSPRQSLPARCAVWEGPQYLASA